jgi:hypothetical protein
VREPICTITIALTGGSAPLSALQEPKDMNLAKTKNRYKNENICFTEETDKEQRIKTLVLETPRLYFLIMQPPIFSTKNVTTDIPTLTQDKEPAKLHFLIL